MMAFLALGLIQEGPLCHRVRMPASPGSACPPQRVVSFEHVNQELVLKCTVGMLVIKPYADNVVHVRYYPTLKRTASPPGAISVTPATPKYRAESTPRPSGWC